MVYDAEHIGYRDRDHDAEQQQYGRAGKFYVWGRRSALSLGRIASNP